MNTKEKYTEKLNLKLTKTQCDSIKQYASSHNINVCETIRHMLFDATDDKLELQLNYIINIIILSNISPQNKKILVKEISRHEKSHF